jgi:hypothetical protein
MKLEVFQPEYLTVEITPLLKSIEEAKREIERLGMEHFHKISPAFIPTIHFHTE